MRISEVLLGPLAVMRLLRSSATWRTSSTSSGNDRQAARADSKIDSVTGRTSRAAASQSSRRSKSGKRIDSLVG